MAKAVWKGTLTFGLVSLPVALYPATESHAVRFHQLQRGTTDRVRLRRVNERTGEEVPFEDVVKGYELAEGQYVVVEPAELEELSPGRSRTIEIGGFADLAEIDPVFFDKTYYLGPADPATAKVYQLLVEALAHSHRAGIAVFAMRGKEYLTAVDSADGLLELRTMHWADELRDPQQEVPDLPDRRRDFNRTELATAEQLIEMLSVGWNPEDYHDTYEERVRELVEAKAEGREVALSTGDEPEPTELTDLVDVLRRSLDEARAARGGSAGGARAGRAGAGRAGAGRAAGSKGSPKRGRAGREAPEPAEAVEDLASLSKTELYRRAAALGVPHRSTMTRDQLQYALKAAARPRRKLGRAS
ncbi:non-homologous end joining protein Ku [Kitasatospora phosalacinea]|uniref:Non-homologous end joining protein Ku n=1 Tax=Kitasatospora phosalacinea TaxID=2065 RepID=A0A9W6QD40_9ACTN|nr:Ku protein [Kitasatospora phosalacinea]GLW72864.1 non-homologous end joining protein Ku [Kitasatospora phosalacinea]